MNIIVTGASRGVGYEAVKKICEKGQHTIIVIARSDEKLKTLIKECSSINKEVELFSIKIDLENFKEEELLEDLQQKIKHLDILINNAGYIVCKPIQELEQKDIRKMFEVNVIGVMRLIKGCLPLLERSKQAHILNISSMGGVQGTVKFPGLSAYSSSKGALLILTECLAEEFKDKKIAVNALALGAVQTEMLEAAFPDYKAPISAEQMGAYVAEFALEGHTFYNGKVLPVAMSTP